MRLTTHRSAPEDLITAFIKKSEVEWGEAKEEDDDDSSSGPSQYWGESPERTRAAREAAASTKRAAAATLTHFYKLDDSASDSASSDSRGPPSKQEAGFPDVPIEIWGGCWSRVLSKPWTAAEPQCILEARAAILTLKHICRSRANFARRFLIIGDAMAVVLALTKGRSSSAVLLTICRQWCAYTLAADVYPHIRWVPSQGNAADDSSRDKKRHLADSDVAESQVAR